MWSVYKGSEVEWGVGLGEMCVTESCIVRFAHCWAYLVVFNTESSTLGSNCFWVLIVYNMCSWFILVMLRLEGCLECCMLFCVKCAIVLYYIVLYCTVLHCSTLPPDINPFVDNDDDDDDNNKIKIIITTTTNSLCVTWLHKWDV